MIEIIIGLIIFFLSVCGLLVILSWLFGAFFGTFYLINKIIETTTEKFKSIFFRKKYKIIHSVLQGSCKILHFEDDRDLAHIFANGFKAQNFEYKSYTNPPAKEEELINLVLSENPNLIIMDILMPVMDGFEAIKILKNNPKTKNIPIVGFDNLRDKKTINKIKGCGVSNYFIKSEIGLNDFVEKIKELCNKIIDGKQQNIKF